MSEAIKTSGSDQDSHMAQGSDLNAAPIHNTRPPSRSDSRAAEVTEPQASVVEVSTKRTNSPALSCKYSPFSKDEAQLDITEKYETAHFVNKGRTYLELTEGDEIALLKLLKRRRTTRKKQYRYYRNELDRIDKLLPAAHRRQAAARAKPAVFSPAPQEDQRNALERIVHVCWDRLSELEISEEGLSELQRQRDKLAMWIWGVQDLDRRLREYVRSVPEEEEQILQRGYLRPPSGDDKIA